MGFRMFLRTHHSDICLMSPLLLWPFLPQGIRVSDRWRMRSANSERNIQQKLRNHWRENLPLTILFLFSGEHGFSSHKNYWRVMSEHCSHVWTDIFNWPLVHMLRLLPLLMTMTFSALFSIICIMSLPLYYYN